MITERMMLGWLHDYFIGNYQLPADVDVLKWPWPFKDVFLIADYLTMDGFAAVHEAFRSVVKDDDERNRLMRQFETAGEPAVHRTLAEIAENLPPVAWLWPNWLPRGMVSLLGAYQGTGKSFFVLDLARAIIAGDVWPDGAAVEKRGCVLYVEAEAIPQVTNQRAVELAVDRGHLYLLMADGGELLDLTQSRWQDQLIDMVHDLRPELVIIDSLTSISSVGQNSVEDTNRLLMFLVGLARFGNCGMLVIHHLRKPSGQSFLPGLSIHDFRGSGHITAMARTVLGLSVVQTGKQFSLNGPRRLDLVKTNLGPYPDSLGVELRREGERVQFVYGPAPDYERTETKADNVEDWLIEFLGENGPTRPAEVVDAAEEQGYGRTVVYAARRKLAARILNTEGYRSPKNCWCLPHQAAEQAEEDENEA